MLILAVTLVLGKPFTYPYREPRSVAAVRNKILFISHASLPQVFSR